MKEPEHATDSLRQPEIVVIGSLNTDLVATVPRFPGAGETLVGQDFQTYCGGKGANQAFAAAKLGGSVAMLGRIGDDAFGTEQLHNLQNEGVHTSTIQRDEHQPTGTAIIGVEPSGENRIIVIPGANESFRPEHLDAYAPIINEARIVLLQLEIPLATVSHAIQLARAAEVPVIFDPAPAPSAPLPSEWLNAIDVLTPNLGELGTLTGVPLDEEAPMNTIADAARQLCAQGSRCIIAKLGPRGALRVTRDQVDHWPAPALEVIDTTAAGDCFNAAYAVKRIEGASEPTAGAFAVRAASLSTTRPGAQAAMPTLKEVEARWRSGP